jgi:hypothetical protein
MPNRDLSSRIPSLHSPYKSTDRNQGNWTSTCDSLENSPRASAGGVRKMDVIHSYIFFPDNESLQFRRSKYECNAVLESPIK